MILSFVTRELRDLCQRLELADQAFGAKQAQALFRVLAEAEASGTADEFLLLYAGQITTGQDSLLIAFAPQCTASFEAVQARLASADNRQLDWSNVRRLKLTQVKVETNGN